MSDDGPGVQFAMKVDGCKPHLQLPVVGRT